VSTIAAAPSRQELAEMPHAHGQHAAVGSLPPRPLSSSHPLALTRSVTTAAPSSEYPNSADFMQDARGRKRLTAETDSTAR
jgi:hypothetical protein